MQPDGLVQHPCAIYGLDLQGNDLVVLSACQTDVGALSAGVDWPGYAISRWGLSTSCTTRCRKRAAGPPSTSRWSKVRLSQAVGRATT